MEKKLDIKQALRVFSKISEYGQRVEGEYRLNGMWATTDFDGYTVILRDEAVTLHIFFHNTHKFTYKRRVELENFVARLAEIDRLQLYKSD